VNTKKTVPGADRCEVCRVALVERPDSRRRRCADHLDQLVLVPLNHVRRARKEGNR
jgi:hypothetical protein